MQTIQYRKSRIWEIKEDKYTKRLAKNQFCVILHMQDIRKNVFPKFIRLCMETLLVSLWGAQIWTPERGWIGPLINQFYGFPFHSLFRSFLKKIVIWGADFPGKASTPPSPQGLWTLISLLWLFQGSTPLCIVLFGFFLCIKKSILWIYPPFFIVFLSNKVCYVWCSIYTVKGQKLHLPLQLRL